MSRNTRDHCLGGFNFHDLLIFESSLDLLEEIGLKQISLARREWHGKKRELFSLLRSQCRFCLLCGSDLSKYKSCANGIDLRKLSFDLAQIDYVPTLELRK